MHHFFTELHEVVPCLAGKHNQTIQTFNIVLKYYVIISEDFQEEEISDELNMSGDDSSIHTEDLR